MQLIFKRNDFDYILFSAIYWENKFLQLEIALKLIK